MSARLSDFCDLVRTTVRNHLSLFSFPKKEIERFLGISDNRSPTPEEGKLALEKMGLSGNIFFPEDFEARHVDAIPLSDLAAQHHISSVEVVDSITTDEPMNDGDNATTLRLYKEKCISFNAENPKLCGLAFRVHYDGSWTNAHRSVEEKKKPPKSTKRELKRCERCLKDYDIGTDHSVRCVVRNQFFDTVADIQYRRDLPMAPKDGESMDAFSTRYTHFYVDALMRNFSLSKSTFFGGPAGYGKTAALKSFIQKLKDVRGLKDEEILIVAHQGTSARNVDGVTFHSAFRGFSGSLVNGTSFVHTYEKTKEAYLQIVEGVFEKKGEKNGRHQYFEKMATIKLLVVEEVSMLSLAQIIYAETMFEVIAERKKLRGSFPRNSPFSHVCGVLMGDFTQLSPITNERDALQFVNAAPYVFLWPRFKDFIPLAACFPWRFLGGSSSRLDLDRQRRRDFATFLQRLSASNFDRALFERLPFKLMDVDTFKQRCKDRDSWPFILSQRRVENDPVMRELEHLAAGDEIVTLRSRVFRVCENQAPAGSSGSPSCQHLRSEVHSLNELVSRSDYQEWTKKRKDVLLAPPSKDFELEELDSPESSILSLPFDRAIDNSESSKVIHEVLLNRDRQVMMSLNYCGLYVDTPTDDPNTREESPELLNRSIVTVLEIGKNVLLVKDEKDRRFLVPRVMRFNSPSRGVSRKMYGAYAFPIQSALVMTIAGSQGFTYDKPIAIDLLREPFNPQTLNLAISRATSPANITFLTEFPSLRRLAVEIEANPAVWYQQPLMCVDIMRQAYTQNHFSAFDPSDYFEELADGDLPQMVLCRLPYNRWTHVVPAPFRKRERQERDPTGRQRHRNRNRHRTTNVADEDETTGKATNNEEKRVFCKEDIDMPREGKHLFDALLIFDIENAPRKEHAESPSGAAQDTYMMGITFIWRQQLFFLEGWSRRGYKMFVPFIQYQRANGVIIFERGLSDDETYVDRLFLRFIVALKHFQYEIAMEECGKESFTFDGFFPINAYGFNSGSFDLIPFMRRMMEDEELWRHANVRSEIIPSVGAGVTSIQLRHFVTDQDITTDLKKNWNAAYLARGKDGGIWRVPCTILKKPSRRYPWYLISYQNHRGQTKEENVDRRDLDTMSGKSPRNLVFLRFLDLRKLLGIGSLGSYFNDFKHEVYLALDQSHQGNMESLEALFMPKDPRLLQLMREVRMDVEANLGHGGKMEVPHQFIADEGYEIIHREGEVVVPATYFPSSDFDVPYPRFAKHIRDYMVQDVVIPLIPLIMLNKHIIGLSGYSILRVRTLQQLTMLSYVTSMVESHPHMVEYSWLQQKTSADPGRDCFTFDLPVYDADEASFILEASFGGKTLPRTICEVQDGGRSTKRQRLNSTSASSLSSGLHFMDFASMYASIMEKSIFPYGRMVKTRDPKICTIIKTFIDEAPPNILSNPTLNTNGSFGLWSFFFAARVKRVDHPRCFEVSVPNPKREGATSINWSPEPGGCTQVLTCVDIANIKRDGSMVQDVIEVMYWEKSGPFMMDYVSWVSDNRAKYKGKEKALDVLFKTLANALYGAMLKKDRREVKALVHLSNVMDITKDMEYYSITPTENGMFTVVGERMVNHHGFSSRSLHLGIFVLSYSRQLLQFADHGSSTVSPTVFSLEGVKQRVKEVIRYSDTDSAILESPRIIQAVKHDRAVIRQAFLFLRENLPSFDPDGAFADAISQFFADGETVTSRHLELLSTALYRPAIATRIRATTSSEGHLPLKLSDRYLHSELLFQIITRFPTILAYKGGYLRRGGLEEDLGGKALTMEQFEALELPVITHFAASAPKCFALRYLLGTEVKYKIRAKGLPRGAKICLVGVGDGQPSPPLDVDGGEEDGDTITYSSSSRDTFRYVFTAFSQPDTYLDVYRDVSFRNTNMFRREQIALHNSAIGCLEMAKPSTLINQHMRRNISKQMWGGRRLFSDEEVRVLEQGESEARFRTAPHGFSAISLCE